MRAVRSPEDAHLLPESEAVNDALRILDADYSERRLRAKALRVVVLQERRRREVERRAHFMFQLFVRAAPSASSQAAASVLHTVACSNVRCCV